MGEDLLGRPRIALEETARAVVGHDVGLDRRVEGPALVGAGRAVEPGAAHRDHASRAAIEGTWIARVPWILEEDGVDAVRIAESGGGPGGAGIAVADVGAGVVVPRLQGDVEGPDRRVEPQAGLAAAVDAPRDAPPLVEIEPADRDAVVPPHQGERV